MESHVAMLVARSPVGVSVAKHGAPGLQTCGLGRASLTLAKNFKLEENIPQCNWKTVIGASCPPVPQSYTCHVKFDRAAG